VEWIDFASCLPCLIRRSALVVCMGGYNTLCEVVTAGRPALVIPRTQPRLEQAIRARLWERRGLVRVVEPAGLTPQRLADEVAGLLAKGEGESGNSTAGKALDLGGLDRVCERLAILMNGGARRAVAVPVH
jgi:predicted glycosyltransferase